MKYSLTSGVRLAWLDYIKGICMFGIIIVHLCTVPFYDALIMPWCLTGFFFVSGYTYKTYNSFADFLMRKIKALLIPVFSFGILNALLTYFAYHISLSERLMGLFCQIPGHGDDMWFVACLFVMCLMYYPISKIGCSWIRFSVCLMFLFAGIVVLIFVNQYLPWHIITACMMLLILDAGYAFKSLDGYVSIKQYMSRCPWWLIFAAWTIFVTFAFSISNSTVDIHLNKYGNIGAYYLNVVLALVPLVVTCIKLEEYNALWIAKCLSFVGRHSLTFYGLQSKTITTIVKILSVAGISTIAVPAQPVLALFVLVALAPVVYIIDRYMPFMCGKRNNKKLLTQV